MSSPSGENEEPSSSTAPAEVGTSGKRDNSSDARPPAKRRFSSTAVIEISDTESDDSDVCAVISYQASADEVKRIRGEEYSSSSSSSEYSSESEDTLEDDSIVVEDTRPYFKAIKAQLNPRANRMDEPIFNPNIKSQELIDRLSLNWKEKKDFKAGDITLTCEPFRLCLLHDFLSNSEMINNIVDDMNTLDWSRKKMDLYEYHQTADLASLTWQRSIRGIYELLKTEVMSWVSEVTGLTLRSVSASCSLYGPGDHLLVHDDMMSDRRVAFILYLAPWGTWKSQNHHNLENGSANNKDDNCSDTAAGWNHALGGALQQLACDELGHPSHVVHSVYPHNNMLAFFQVGYDSYHQVEEVLSMELPRLSINGWFHGPEPTGADIAPEPAPLSPPPDPVRPHNDIVVLSQWLQATYMSPRSRLQIQAQMERESEVCLRDLLLADKLEQLMEALADTEIPWVGCGPAHQRHYEVVSEAWWCRQQEQEQQEQQEQHPVRGVLALFGSAAFVRALAECTELALGGVARLQLARWRPGAYSLLPPRRHYAAARLEATLYLLPAPRPPRPPLHHTGGTTQYVAPGERGRDDGAALVSLPPVHNALALVYCDPGAAAFTKYVPRLPHRHHHRHHNHTHNHHHQHQHHHHHQQTFYMLTCTYHEGPSQ